MVAKSGFAVIAGSLAAASFIVVTQIITLDHPDNFLVASVCVFAIAMPILIKLYMKPPPDVSEPIMSDPRFELLVSYFGVVALDFVGFALVFFHFGLLAGILFIASSLFALWLLMNRCRPKLILEFLIRLAAHPFQKGIEATKKWRSKK